MSELKDPTQFVVWRRTPDVPEHWMPQGMDGRWDYRSVAGDVTAAGDCYVVHTGRYETRSDGEQAEIYEVRRRSDA